MKKPIIAVLTLALLLPLDLPEQALRFTKKIQEVEVSLKLGVLPL